MKSPGLREFLWPYLLRAEEDAEKMLRLEEKRLTIAMMCGILMHT